MAMETCFHILWQCPSAKDVWSMGSIKIQKGSFSGPEFMQAVEGIFSACTKEDIVQFVGLVRRIWLRRNDVLHGGVFSHPRELVQRNLHAIEEYKQAQDDGEVDREDAATLIPIRWEVPDHADAKAASMAVQRCVEMGFLKVHLEGDAKGVVDTVKYTKKSNCRDGHVMEDIKETVRIFFQWRLEFVRRKGNCAAHILAKLVVANLQDRTWTEDFP
ncbi:uncharacterized protein LOC132162872 [Corylus avellana]|uniref:uncharacterized protein LOC132162872 n=1 Tax=Corylus avellana TaxID=13451 RepID=UPI00286A6729|nr:uncharacterized protein LOC132162872 [Corylus avellana]